MCRAARGYEPLPGHAPPQWPAGPIPAKQVLPGPVILTGRNTIKRWRKHCKRHAAHRRRTAKKDAKKNRKNAARRAKRAERGLLPRGRPRKTTPPKGAHAPTSKERKAAQTGPVILRGIVRERREGVGGARRLRSAKGEEFRDRTESHLRRVWLKALQKEKAKGLFYLVRAPYNPRTTGPGQGQPGFGLRKWTGTEAEGCRQKVLKVAETSVDRSDRKRRKKSGRGLEKYMPFKGQQVRRWKDSGEWPACTDWRLLCWCKDAHHAEHQYKLYCERLY